MRYRLLHIRVKADRVLGIISFAWLSSFDGPRNDATRITQFNGQRGKLLDKTGELSIQRACTIPASSAFLKPTVYSLQPSSLRMSPQYLLNFGDEIVRIGELAIDTREPYVCDLVQIE